MGAVARERGGGDQRVLFRPAPARADSPPPCPRRDLVRRMKIPRDVSGTHLADTLCRRWRYTKVHQVGSHIILETSEPYPEGDDALRAASPCAIAADWGANAHHRGGD